jgi:hypothetical protein
MTAAISAATALAVAGVAAAGATAYSAYSANQAAGKQRDAANNATNTQLGMYNQNRADQAPWRQAGGEAVNALEGWYGLPGADGKVDPNAGAADTKLIQSLPGYQFNLQQGNQAVQRDLAAKGLLGSGAAGKALTQYGQGYAMNESNQYLNGLQSLAGLGQTSAGQTGQIGAYTGAQVGSNQIYAGNAQASGYANQSNAINQGLSGLVGAYGNYNQQQYNQNQQNQWQGSQGYYQQNSPYGGYGGGWGGRPGTSGGGTMDLGGNQSGYIVNTP